MTDDSRRPVSYDVSQNPSCRSGGADSSPSWLVNRGNEGILGFGTNKLSQAMHLCIASNHAAATVTIPGDGGWRLVR